jgi:hypothetical protein
MQQCASRPVARAPRGRSRRVPAWRHHVVAVPARPAPTSCPARHSNPVLGPPNKQLGRTS